jgi:hypothetical protein
MTTLLTERRTGVLARQSRWLLWASLVTVVGAFLVRLPGVVEPLGPDQGVYVTIAWGLQHGLALYRDLWEQKPPGIYLTYLLGFVLFGSRPATVFWLDYLAAALTTLVLFDLGRRLVGLRFGALAAAVFAVGTLPAARHAFGGFLERAVTEAFISLLAAGAAWAMVMAITRRDDRWSFATGLLVGIAAIFKQTALIYWLAFVLWAWFITDTVRARRLALHSTAGVVMAPLVTLLWLWSEGVLNDAWVAVVQYPIAYLALGGEGLAGTLNRFVHEVWRRMKTDEVWALGTLSASVALVAWRHWRSTRAGWMASLGVVWLAAALVAVIANGPRMFMTYFIPSLIPLCLLIAWLFHQILASRHRSRVAAGLLVLVFTGAMLAHSGSVNRAISITTWDARHLAGLSDRQEYLQRFRSRDGRAFSAASNERLAEYLRTHTEPGDRIFVFGMTAATYFSSGRFPASRFLWVYPAVSNMIDRPEFHVDTLADELAGTAPIYLVLQRGNGDSFSGWRVEDSFTAPAMVALLRHYRQETEIGNFVLYRLSEASPGR